MGRYIPSRLRNRCSDCSEKKKFVIVEKDWRVKPNGTADEVDKTGRNNRKERNIGALWCLGRRMGTTGSCVMKEEGGNMSCGEEEIKR